MPLEEAPYSNRQIERMFDSQKQSFDSQLEKQSLDIKDHIDSALAPILAQTTKTNGRVTKTEEDVNAVKRWQSYVLGFCACVTLLILPFTFALIKDFLT